MRVTLYGRPGCTLCDEVSGELRRLQALVPHELVEVNIESDAVLLSRFVDQIPVVVIGPYTLRAPISPSDLQVSLQAYASAPRPSERPAFAGPGAVRTNRMLQFVSRHWLALFNLAIDSPPAYPEIFTGIL